MLDLWLTELTSDFGYETLDPGALTAVKLRDAVRQLPFLDPYRIVAVRSLPVRRAIGLAEGLKEIPDTTRVLLAVSGRLPAGNALAKAVAAAADGVTREFQRLKGRALSDWASDRARTCGLPPSIAPMVLRSSPADLGILDSEMRKLAGYHAAGFPLDHDALAALLAGGREEEVFRLTDNLLPRPTGDAFRVARSLVRGGESPTTIAWRLSRQLAMVLAVRARRDRGESLAQVQQAMSEHPFRIQKAFEAAGSIDSVRLEEGLNALLAYEWEVKSGQLDAELGLDGVLARL